MNVGSRLRKLEEDAVRRAGPASGVITYVAPGDERLREKAPARDVRFIVVYPPAKAADRERE